MTSALFTKVASGLMRLRDNGEAINRGRHSPETPIPEPPTDGGGAAAVLREGSQIRPGTLADPGLLLGAEGLGELAVLEKVEGGSVVPDVAKVGVLWGGSRQWVSIGFSLGKEHSVAQDVVVILS